MFDGDEAAGLIPTLFAEDIEAARTAINSDVIKEHYDVNKLNRVLIMPEHLLMREALQLLKKNR